jgi:hypothetical protein
MIEIKKEVNKSKSQQVLKVGTILLHTRTVYFFYLNQLSKCCQVGMRN